MDIDETCICVAMRLIKFSDMQGKLVPEVEDQFGYSEREAFQG